MKKKIITISVISFFSIALWVYVSLSNVFVTTIKVPINITDLPKNYSLGNSSITEVYLQVKGKGWDLAKLMLEPEVKFDISAHRRIGHHKNDLNDLIEANTWLTSSFQVLEISPPQIDYDIEKVGSKTVKLIKNFKLEYKPEYGPSSKIKINPEMIEISGPANLLRKTDSIKTEYKEITDISENVKFDLKIEPPEGITASANVCTVEVEVQKIVDKTFENIVVETRNVPPSKDLILFPGKINVVIRGGINRLGRLTSESIRAYVDYWSALREEKGTVEPVIELPPYTTYVSTIPNKLEYIIKQY